MKISWSHCVLKVRDMDTMVSFYEDILGFVVADRGAIMGGDSPEIVFMSGSSSDHNRSGSCPDPSEWGLPRRHFDTTC